MLKFRKISAVLASVAILATSMSVPASASYIDGDREVDYYDFSIIAGYNYECAPDRPESNGVDKRYEDRNWVVSVNNVSTTKYSVTYSVCRYNDPANLKNNYGYTETIARPCTVRGTGNSGGRYLVDVCAGTTIYMWGNLSSTVPEGTAITTSGQWSPDAAY